MQVDSIITANIRPIGEQFTNKLPTISEEPLVGQYEEWSERNYNTEDGGK